METDVEDFLIEDDNQFSLEEMEDALHNNDNVQLSSGDSQKSPLKELNWSPMKRGKRLAASRPITYRQISLSNSSDNSEVNTSSTNSSDNTAKQPAPKKKRIQRLKKPLAKKKKKYMDKENISDNILETNNRPALLDRTNSSERSTKFPKDARDVNSDKVVAAAKDGKDLITTEKVVTDTSAPVKEVKTERPIPVYKQAVANVRLTPPPVDNKMDLYEFEIDENEQPVKRKKKRQPRVVKSRRNIATKPAKNVLQNIIVPERTISLRRDNTVKDKTSTSKTGVVRFDIVKSIEKHTDALERQKNMVSQSKSINPRSTEKCTGNMTNKSESVFEQTIFRDKNLQPPFVNDSSKPSAVGRNVDDSKVIKCSTNNPKDLSCFDTSDISIIFESEVLGRDHNDTEVDFGFRGFEDVVDKPKDHSKSSTENKSIKKVTSKNQLANKSSDTSIIFESEVLGRDHNDTEVDFGFRGFEDVVDKPKDHSKSSTENKSIKKVTSKNQLANKSSDTSIIFESEVLGRDHNDTEVDFGFCGFEDVVDKPKDHSKSSTENKSIKKVTSKNQLANKSVAQIRQNNRTVHHPIPLIRSINHAPNNSLDCSKIDFDNNFGFDDESDDVVDITKNKSSSSNTDHSVSKVRPTNQTAKRTVKRSNINESKIRLENDSTTDLVDVTKNKSSSSNTNNSVFKICSTSRTANRTVQRSNRNESKFGFDNNFGFDDDSTDLIDVNKENSKTSNTSAASTSNASISNASASSASTSISMETEKAKKPEAQFTDVINRLKGQLNITAVSTPVSTKQTKLNFNFRNKSTVSNDSAADTSICSPIAQQTSTANGGLTPIFLKPPRKSYTHTPKATKTVRFGTSFAFDENEMRHDDDAAEDLFEDTLKEKAAAKKVNQTYKKVGKTVKKEEKEVERLVSAINSQFQKVEEFELCVEK